MKDNNKFKNKNNQSSQKIEPYGSLTTKELKKKHFIQTGRRGGDGQHRQRGCTARQRLENLAGETAAGGPGSPTICMQINWENNLGVRQATHPRVPVWGNKASKPVTEKNLWGLRRQEKLPVSQESTLERPTGS